MNVLNNSDTAVLSSQQHSKHTRSSIQIYMDNLEVEFNQHCYFNIKITNLIPEEDNSSGANNCIESHIFPVMQLMAL